MSPVHRHPDADLPTRRIPFLQLRSLILSLIAEDDDEEEADDGPDTIDDLRQEFEELQPTMFRPRGAGSPIQAVPEPPRVNTLDALVAELRTVYGGPRAQGSTAAPLAHPKPPTERGRAAAPPPSPVHGQGSRVEPLPPRHRTHHSRIDRVDAATPVRGSAGRPASHAHVSQPVPAMAAPARMARGSSQCLEETRARRRSQAEITPGAFPIVAVPRSVPSDFAEPSGVAPDRRSQSRAERAAATLPPPCTSIRPPHPVVTAPRPPRDDRTEPSIVAPFPEAEGSRAEPLPDETVRDPRSRR